MGAYFLPKEGTIGCGTNLGEASRINITLVDKRYLHCIGDDLGKFMDYHKGYIESGKMDTREGLVVSSTLHYRGLVHLQKLDYKGVPFRCRRCHKVDHVYKDCPLLQNLIMKPRWRIKSPIKDLIMGVMLGRIHYKCLAII